MAFPKMKNPLNPSNAELEKWAYLPDAEYPDEMSQDWDLMIISIQRIPLFIKFACDLDCPNQTFFLHCLYLTVGDCVKRRAPSAEVKEIRGYIAGLKAEEVPEIGAWANRTVSLLDNPESFDYYKWCGWGYVSGRDS